MFNSCENKTLNAMILCPAVHILIGDIMNKAGTWQKYQTHHRPTSPCSWLTNGEQKGWNVAKVSNTSQASLSLLFIDKQLTTRLECGKSIKHITSQPLLALHWQWTKRRHAPWEAHLRWKSTAFVIVLYITCMNKHCFCNCVHSMYTCHTPHTNDTNTPHPLFTFVYS